jgi:hypothetical protein
MFDWIGSNWFELGSLALQLAILSVAVSYGRKALRILSVPLAAGRAVSQAQVELLQDLENLSEMRGPRSPAESRQAAEPRPAVYGGVGRFLSPMPDAQAAASREESAAPANSEDVSPWRALKVWLNRPWGNRPGPVWRRVVRQHS